MENRDISKPPDLVYFTTLSRFLSDYTLYLLMLPYQIVHPPSITSVAPVTYAEASEARKTTGPLMSS